MALSCSARQPSSKRLWTVETLLSLVSRYPGTGFTIFVIIRSELRITCVWVPQKDSRKQCYSYYTGSSKVITCDLHNFASLSHVLIMSKSPDAKYTLISVNLEHSVVTVSYTRNGELSQTTSCCVFVYVNIPNLYEVNNFHMEHFFNWVSRVNRLLLWF